MEAAGYVPRRGVIAEAVFNMNILEKQAGLIDGKKALCYTKHRNGNFYRYQLNKNGE